MFVSSISAQPACLKLSAASRVCLLVGVRSALPVSLNFVRRCSLSLGLIVGASLGAGPSLGIALGVGLSASPGAAFAESEHADTEAHNENAQDADAPGRWYAVWSAALSHGLGHDAGAILIRAETIPAPWSRIANEVTPAAANDDARPRETWLADPRPVLGPEGNSLAHYRISRRLDLPTRVFLIDNKTLDVLFTKGPDAGWDALRRRFPESPGLVGLSAVRFTADGETAQVYLDFGCGAECGAGRVLTLIRDAHGNWQPADSELTWVAAGAAPAGGQPRAETDTASGEGVASGAGDGQAPNSQADDGQTDPAPARRIHDYPLEPDSAL